MLTRGAFEAGALPRTPLGELTPLRRPLAGFWRGERGTVMERVRDRKAAEGERKEAEGKRREGEMEFGAIGGGKLGPGMERARDENLERG